MTRRAVFQPEYVALELGEQAIGIGIDKGRGRG